MTSAPATEKSRVRPVTPIEVKRRSLRLSQTAAAARARISREHFSAIERGLLPPVPLQERLAAALGASVGELWPSRDGGGPS